MHSLVRQVRQDRFEIHRLQISAHGGHGAVDHHVAEEVEQLLSAVLRRRKLKQLRILIDEVGVNTSCGKKARRSLFHASPPHTFFKQEITLSWQYTV